MILVLRGKILVPEGTGEIPVYEKSVWFLNPEAKGREGFSRESLAGLQRILRGLLISSASACRTSQEFRILHSPNLEGRCWEITQSLPESENSAAVLKYTVCREQDCVVVTRAVRLLRVVVTLCCPSAQSGIGVSADRSK